MRLLPRSLRGRLLASAALFTLLALLATGATVQVVLHRFVQGQIDQRLDTQLNTVADALGVGPDGAVMLTRSVDGPPFDDPRSGWIWRVRTPTSVLRSGAQLPPPPPPPGPEDLHAGKGRPLPARGGDGPRGTRETDEAHLLPPGEKGGPPEISHGLGGPGREPPPPPIDGPDARDRPLWTRVQSVDVGGQPVLIEAAAPLEAIDAPMRQAMRPLAITLVVLGAGLALATLIQVRIGLRPLADLRGALAAVRTGRADRLPGDQPAELGPLVAEMNGLLAQNAANLERARRHVANLAHALKTPLATLTIALDAPGRAADRPLLELAGSMDRRIRHHLARARTASLGGAARHALPLAPRIADHVAAFTKIQADKAVLCELDVPSGFTVACDPQDLDEIVGNVLDNAFKWARSRVKIAAVSEGKTVRLAVEDDGPGIPEAQREAVLRPGQRLDESVPGDGFGLAIVGELAELYGGSLDLASARLGGLRVSLTLPSAGP